MNRFKAGIIGLGSIGHGYDAERPYAVSATHASAYLNSKEVVLAAVTDPSPRALEQFVQQRLRFTGQATPSLEVFLRHNLDIISICAPTAAHASLAETVIKAQPKCLFMEKPFTGNTAHAERLAALAAKQGVKLVVNYHRQWDPLHQEIIARLRCASSATCHAYFCRGLRHNGSHLVRLLIAAFGLPQRCLRWTDAAANTFYQLQFSEGCRANLLPVVEPTFTIEFRFAGGMIRLENGGRLAIWEENHERHTCATDWVGGLDEAVDDLVACIRESRQPQINTAQEAIDVLRVLDALENAQEEQSPMELVA
jgi:predicted dehydrogenase